MFDTDQNEKITNEIKDNKLVIAFLKAASIDDMLAIGNVIGIVCDTPPVRLCGNDYTDLMEVIDVMEEEALWKCTDPDSNQYSKYINDTTFAFKEDRVVDPETQEVETYESEICLDSYTPDQMFEEVTTFGYTREAMDDWLDQGINLGLIAECIFENER